MIDREHDLSITKQTKALNISRGSVYYLPRPVSAADLAVMRRMDELHLELPFAQQECNLLPPRCKTISGAIGYAYALESLHGL